MSRYRSFAASEPPRSIRLTPLLALLLGVFVAAQPATAQQKVELTPFVGYQFGGTFEEDFDDDDDFDFFDDVDVEESESVGLILGFSLAPNFNFELLYSLQETDLEETGLFGGDVLSDLEIEYFHLGLQWQWFPRKKVRPFVVASVGATRFSLPDDEDTRFSAALGGGVKIFVTDHVGFRLDGRLYSTFVDEEEEIDCGRRRCYRYEDDVTFLQFDAKFGLIIAF